MRIDDMSVYTDDYKREREKHFTSVSQPRWADWMEHSTPISYMSLSLSLSVRNCNGSVSQDITAQGKLKEDIDEQASTLIWYEGPSSTHNPKVRLSLWCIFYFHNETERRQL